MAIGGPVAGLRHSRGESVQVLNFQRDVLVKQFRIGYHPRSRHNGGSTPVSLRSETWLLPCVHLITVPIEATRELASKHPVDKHEVAGREGHPETPPDQADLQGVLARMRIEDRDIQARVGG